MATAREVDKLQLKDGDILLFRPKVADESYRREAEAIRNHLWSHGVEDVLIMVLAPGTEMETLNEEQMNEHGWFRKEADVDVEDDDAADLGRWADDGGV